MKYARHSKTFRVIAATLLAIAWLVSIVPPLQAETPKSKTEAPLEWVLLGGRQIVRIQIQIEVNGQSPDTIWADTFARLFQFFDADADGKLDKAEAAKLPSPFGIRQAMWSGNLHFADPISALLPVDQNKDGTVELEELTSFYTNAGLGNVMIGVGRPLATDELTESLIRQIDSDANGSISRDEFESADGLLETLDANDDELLGPGELITDTAYPGAAGTIILRSPAQNRPTTTFEASFPVMILPIDRNDTCWANVLLRRLDANSDGRLSRSEAALQGDMFEKLDGNNDRQVTAVELAHWRDTDANVVWNIHLEADGSRVGKTTQADEKGKTTGSNASVQFNMGDGGLDLRLRADEGKLSAMAEAGRKKLQSMFEEADIDQNGNVSREESAKPDLSPLRSVIRFADHNADGQLARTELASWNDLQERLSRALILVTLLDHEAGLFEFLDTNYDGALSTRELRSSWQRVHAVQPHSDKQFNPNALPGQLRAVISLGHPQSILSPPSQVGPSWFFGMDRNHDGDLTRREFLGTDGDFQLLDRDSDNLISADEALWQKGE